MSTQLIKKVRQAIDRHRMLETGDGVVVAVSGGPDSVALLAILKHLSEAYRLRLVVAHLNHGLRPGPADEEETFVQRFSERLGLICESTKRDIAVISRLRKQSVEETAREERYRFLEEIRQQYRARKIALGHHARDQVETVLMNLLRGSGPEGLKGMRPVREDIYIRPLLGICREEIDEYLIKHNLPYLIDSSNADENYVRNRIRHQLVPELKAHYNPRLEENLCRTAEILRREDEYFSGVIAQLAADLRMVRKDAAHREVVLSIPACLGLHEALQGRLIKHLLLEHAQKMQGISYIHIHDIKALMRRANPGGSLHLPFGIEVWREKDVLVIGQRKKPARDPKSMRRDRAGAPAGHPGAGMASCDIQVPGRTRLEPLGLALSLDFVGREAVRFGDGRTVYMDYARIVPPLIIRTPRPGDRIQPLGMPGMKKVMRYFVDRKVPMRLRGQIPLLIDAHSVVWIVGQQISERVKIADNTTNILRITVAEII
jgi:tRNA(Ile)-lysidine synthase